MGERRTKITEILDAYNITYRILPHSEPVFTVESAAKQRGVVMEEMVKSILLRDKGQKYVMACITGDARLNPKAVRACLNEGWRRLQFASSDEILKVTGCVQGAVAPLGLPSNLPVFFDHSIAQCTKVSISSGDPMAGIELDPLDLIRVAKAKLANISE
jgi:Cys-tRNA(Pro) deacylase